MVTDAADSGLAGVVGSCWWVVARGVDLTESELGQWQQVSAAVRELIGVSGYWFHDRHGSYRHRPQPRDQR
jgi:hypothetical protein